MFLKLKNIVRLWVKSLIPLAARVLGVKLLNKDQTLKFLKSAEINFHRQNSVQLLPVETFGGTIKGLDKGDIIKSSYSAVYCLSGKAVKILPYGGIQVRSKVLDLDFGSSEFLRSCFSLSKRDINYSKNCIVLWSHKWGGGYYDFLFYIYAKLLRIREVIGEEEYQRSVVLCPIFGKKFEKEFWKIAGLEENQVLDVRSNIVAAEKYYFANNENWFFPNTRDIKNLIKLPLSVSIKKFPEYKRIYISRKIRRKLRNEEEIIQVLKEFDFKIIEDKTRTVKEQMEIYSSADVIIGPHGASFANILWCRPNTILIEMFSNRYYPPFFKYLANVLKLKYYAIFEKEVRTNDEAYSYKNFSISPKVLRSSLSRIFSRHKVECPSVLNNKS
ncbi:Protein of unknown function [Salegentibacter holothuriorum]|uniref:Glycosyltransferase 61 catalytic domain-containing protein n=1 Tax=Salegentibacter holothuriorum TaxID=241145 RepID=A0A1T5CSF9_9FLAO|nr:glycosyltransferase family 61 protein [Salegentibacter holothuriorum]SKB62110.1 Protein of unknown function [Salegentibacter holothuriorum]